MTETDPEKLKMIKQAIDSSFHIKKEPLGGGENKENNYS
jgi:hypothetical protein